MGQGKQEGGAKARSEHRGHYAPGEASGLRRYSLPLHSWPHAPARKAHPAASLILTGRTYGKLHHFRGEERLTLLQTNLFELALEMELRLDDVQGRKVWLDFRDTSLTDWISYLCRLHYVHANAVHHELVGAAREYPFCSAHWFETHADEAWVRTVYLFKIDRVDVPDDFEL